jgi:hypothetical protein
MSLEGTLGPETGMNPTQIVTEAVLVVSILDGSMKHPSVRRCLRASQAGREQCLTTIPMNSRTFTGFER